MVVILTGNDIHIKYGETINHLFPSRLSAVQ